MSRFSGTKYSSEMSTNNVVPSHEKYSPVNILDCMYNESKNLEKKGDQVQTCSLHLNHQVQM
jgi:hypothetical protein